MTDLEQRMREAYDAQHLPEGLRARTLAAIEEKRVTEEVPSAEPSFRVLRRRPRARTLTALAACLLLVLAIFGAYGVYQTPSAYVDIDVNPAIELVVNPLGIVIDAEGLNDDGRAVLAGAAVVHRPYRDAIDRLAKNEAFTASVGEDGFIDINVIAESDNLSEQLLSESSEALSTMPGTHACHRADAATRDAAAAAGLCVGRYRAAQELIALDPSYTLEECADMSMRQLHDHINECHAKTYESDSNEESSGQDCGSGNGGGHGHGRGRHGA